MPKRISYRVSSIEVVKVLLWNTGNVTHIAEFHIINIWNRKQNSDGICFLPTRKCRTWTKMAWRRCSDCSALNKKYKCTQNFQDDWRMLIKRTNSMHQYAEIYLLQRQTLHVSGVTAPILRSFKNCIRYLWYRSPLLPSTVAWFGWALWRPKHAEFDVAVNKCLLTDASSWSFLLIVNTVLYSCLHLLSLKTITSRPSLPILRCFTIMYRKRWRSYMDIRD
jgi:hypothetical protein